MGKRELTGVELRTIAQALWEHYAFNGHRPEGEKIFQLAERFTALRPGSPMHTTYAESHMVLDALRAFAKQDARVKGRGDRPWMAQLLYTELEQQFREVQSKKQGNAGGYKRKG
tara:strand:- start:58 stop:399 length:342 start_codon:yes stop_codon:yes gene_type:complete